MASKKAPVKSKVSAVKKAAKPVPAKKSPEKKKAPVAAKPAPKAPVKAAVKPPVKAVAKPIPVVRKAKPAAAAAPVEDVQFKTNMTAKELDFFKDLLLKFRDRVIDEMNFLAKDNLNRSGKEGAGDLSSYSFHMADQGTDNFDREFAANLLSGEQDVLYEVEEALRRIDAGSYGVCEMSGQPIERERLKVIPYARYSVAIQSQMEKGKPRFRPFKRTSIQQSTGEP